MNNSWGDFGPWVRQYPEHDVIRKAEELPLRRDMVTLIQYVHENKVIGTRSTGNMPLKAVREVTARFVNPPKLDHRIGDREYRLRSEEDVWPLYFLHILAEVGGLVVIEPARRWWVTAGGVRFLRMGSLLQVLFLLGVWWWGVNWLVAYPYEWIGEELPERFEQAALRRILEFQVGERVLFEGFAEGLIEDAGLKWQAKRDSWREFLRIAVKRMVVDTLADFGVVEREYREKALGRGTISKLVAFKVTPLGWVLLKEMAIAVS